ncbi:MAG: B12-binding domain-containing protein [Planctomycetes bacterium]|nr:B12-binding domain-containing protein [Planctomycetota bacterium]
MADHPAFVSPRDAALAVGASESSFKRWVDQGLLTVERTAGGHRRIPVAEVVRFARGQGLAVRDPAVLGLPSAPPRESLDLRLQVHRALIAGDGPAVRELLLAAHLAGTPVAQLCDGPVQVAMERIGTLWREGALGVATEHQATQLCLQALASLRALSSPPPAGAPLALGCAPAGDPYLLPTACAAAALAEAGWHAVDLGPDTPFPALEAAVAVRRPQLVWCSVSGDGAAPGLARSLSALARRLAPVALVVGGRRLGDLRAAGLDPQVRTAESLGALVAVAGQCRSKT